MAQGNRGHFPSHQGPGSSLEISTVRLEGRAAGDCYKLSSLLKRDTRRAGTGSLLCAGRADSHCSRGSVLRPAAPDGSGFHNGTTAKTYADSPVACGPERTYDRYLKSFCLFISAAFLLLKCMGSRTLSLCVTASPSHGLGPVWHILRMCLLSECARPPAPPGQELSLLISVAPPSGRDSRPLLDKTVREARRQLLKNPI